MTTPRFLREGTTFAHLHRFAIVPFLTRFETVVYWIDDAAVCDDRGFAQTVNGPFDTHAEALAWCDRIAAGTAKAEPIFA